MYLLLVYVYIMCYIYQDADEVEGRDGNDDYF